MLTLIHDTDLLWSQCKVELDEKEKQKRINNVEMR